MSHYAAIKSIASFVPKNCVPNEAFASFLDTSDEWITQRTGIKTRFFADNTQKSSDLGVEAAKLAIERAKISLKDIDLVLCASISPDFFGMPSTACIIASKLGLKDVPAFDMTAACTGFIYMLSTAKAYIESGMYQNILLIGAEKISSILDFTDRSTCVLFGDGAGACVIGVSDRIGILDLHISANGDFSHLLYTPKHNVAQEYLQFESHVLPQESCLQNSQTLKMKGNEVFRIAVRTIAQDAEYILKKNNISTNTLDYFIPHQANLRIIQSVANTLNLPTEKTIITVNKYGNTSAASIPMALDWAYCEKKICNRDLLLLDAFGSGFTWGSALVYADFA